MSWRTVIISSSSKLDYQMGYLVIRNEEVTKIHLSEIGILMMESTAVSLTAVLLVELTKQKIKVIFCDEKRNPSSQLLPYYGCHDTSMKIRNQIVWSSSAKQNIWTEIVTEKILKQMSTLQCYVKPEYKMLKKYVDEIRPGDETNREGHAAKVYFNAMFGKEFTREADNAINAGLNYGYSIILSVFTREVVLNGYLTQLGLFHDNMFNPYNLACDLMEPYRPLIDRKVYQLQLEEFTHEDKMTMVNILNEYVVINARKEFVSNAIKIYCRSVFDALNENDISLLRFYTDEL